MRYHSIIKKYNAENAQDCKKKLLDQIEKQENKANIYLIIITIIYVALFLFIAFYKKHVPQFILVYIFIAFTFLLIGLFLPMLNIDARISSLQFKLLGENLNFTDEILYYKSKSIMEMARILLSQSQIKIVLVGVLVLVFSILFPISKLIASIYKLYKPKTKNK